MTITTNLAPKYGEKKFSHRPASTTPEAVGTLAAGGALAGLAIWRRGWTGAASGALGAFLLYRGVRDFQRPYQGRVRISFAIGKDRQQVYDFASNPENWSKFMHAVQVENRENGRFAISLRTAGNNFESHAEVTDRQSGEHIAWASGNQVIEHRGVVRFKPAPGNRGTEVSVALEYKAPAGPIARGLASLAGWNPEQVVRESLRHLKQLLEAGEIPTTEGQPSGARGARGKAKRIIFREGLGEHAPEEARMAGD